MLQGDLKKTIELVVEERGFHGKMMENGIFTYMDSVDFCGYQEKWRFVSPKTMGHIAIIPKDLRYLWVFPRGPFSYPPSVFQQKRDVSFTDQTHSCKCCKVPR